MLRPLHIHTVGQTHHILIDDRSAVVAEIGYRGDTVDHGAYAKAFAAAPDMLDVLKRLIEPAPGVAKLPAWVYGIVKPVIAKAEGL